MTTGLSRRKLESQRRALAQLLLPLADEMSETVLSITTKPHALFKPTREDLLANVIVANLLHGMSRIILIGKNNVRTL